MGRNNRNRNTFRITETIRKKLAVFFIIILAAFIALGIRLYTINRDKGDEYKKKVLSQQKYDSITLPAKRGEITDRNGTKIAVSQKVYNVVVDSKTLNGNDGANIEPTLSAIYACTADFSMTESELRSYIINNPGSQYKIIAKKASYEDISSLMGQINNSEYPDIKGVWLEETYQREYPYNSLACDVIGFMAGDKEGYGLEGFYNSTLTGINGREYGYLNNDSNLERTIKPAENGRTLVTSLDVNIQSIVEKHILAFNEEHKDEFREGDGSENTGVIIMNPNTGEILAMASYPTYNLNDPWNTDGLTIEVDEEYANQGIMQDQSSLGGEDSSETGNKDESEEIKEEDTESTDAAKTDLASDGTDSTKPVGYGENTDETEQAQEKVVTYEDAYEKAKSEALNALWKNFCVSSTYEPGSTMKPFTMAVALEEGVYSGNESFVCNGSKDVGDHTIHCNNRLGHGTLSFSGALEQSCNVALMDIGASIGKKMFMKYNKIFNFGLKTNIDLNGEARTDSLVFDVNTMTPTDLAISSFGQGFNVTMIQMITGFCSLINGGYYYQPHVVTKIIDDTGATVSSIEPRILKQTISKETSDKIVGLCDNVVSVGTGKSARPAGYKIGGKTGTAEKYPRGTGNYVVSFIGFAPADNPQIAIYTVIDTPNVEGQASAKYATVLTKDILTEVLPYMQIFMTEELSENEKLELEEKQLSFAQTSTLETEEDTKEASGEENGENTLEGTDSQNTDTTAQSTDVIEVVAPESDKVPERVVTIDPETGYAIDPDTGKLLDPDTGEPIDGTLSNLE